MRWLLLLTIVAVIAYFFYSRKSGSVGLPKSEARAFRDLLEEERAQGRAEKEEMIDRAARKGKTIPLSHVVEPLERSKEVYKGDARYVAAVDRTIEELKRRYDGEIPVDEAYRFVKPDRDDSE